MPDILLAIARRRVVLAAQRVASLGSDLFRAGIIDRDTFELEYRARPKTEADLDGKCLEELTTSARQYESRAQDIEHQLAAFQSLEQEGTVKRPEHKLRTQPKL